MEEHALFVLRARKEEKANKERTDLMACLDKEGHLEVKVFKE